MKALAGKRILITRARSQAGVLAAALENEGAEVIAIPTIEILPPDSYRALDRALENARKYQWLILTSVNGVEALAARLQALSLAGSALNGLKIVAIGPATARALQRNRLQVDLVPEQYVAESVVDALRGQVAGQNVLLVRAKVARDVIPVELRKLGAAVDVVDAYQTVVLSASCDELRRLFMAADRLPHAVTFTSSSTVSNFFALLRHAGFPSLPAEVAAVSIGPITSRTLREHGVEPAMEAAEFTIPGLVAALVRWTGAER